MDISRLRQWHESLRNARSGWDSRWKTVSDLFLPRRFRLDNDASSWKEPGQNERLYNSRGVLALRTLAAGLQGGMTSPARPWFRLALKDETSEIGANAWIEEVTERMRNLFHASNFYNTAHAMYADLAAFGTALMVETADEDGLKFHLARPGEYVLDVNSDNEVDVFFRSIAMSARQIVEAFGEAACPAFIVSMARSHGSGEERFNVAHGVFPNTERDFTASIGYRAMPYASVYWLEQGNVLLSQGGYTTFPAFAPRWDAAGPGAYGRSPAMDVLADCNMLQAMTVTMRRLQHKLADPPMVADSSLQAFGVDTAPGALNFADMGAVARNGAVQPIAMPNPASLNFTMQAIAEVEKVIGEGMYTDLFRLMVDDERRGITATEVQARQQEKLMLIGPVVERLHKEFLEPLITRTFDLMRQFRALPDLPEGLEGRELSVSFESVLAQAQKLMATSAIDQGWAFALNAAQARPESLDIVNVDAMLKGYLKRTGMPESCLNDDEVVERLRKERAEAQKKAEREQEIAAMTQNIQGLTEAAKNLGQTPAGADGQTLMQTLTGGLGGG